MKVQILMAKSLFTSGTLELLPPTDEIYFSTLKYSTKEIKHNIQNKQHDTLPWVGQALKHSSSWPWTPAILGEQGWIGMLEALRPCGTDNTVQNKSAPANQAAD